MSTPTTTRTARPIRKTNPAMCKEFGMIALDRIARFEGNPHAKPLFERPRRGQIRIVPAVQFSCVADKGGMH